MPLYTYLCQKCSHQFDILVGVNKEAQEFRCEKCGSKSIERIISGSFGIGKSSSSPSGCQSSCPHDTCPYKPS